MKKRFTNKRSGVILYLLMACLILPSIVCTQESYAQTTLKESENAHNGGKSKGKGRTLDIVKNGKTNYVIAIPNEATKIEKTAANELRDYILKSSGVEMRIVKEKDVAEKAIMIGATNFVQNKDIAIEGKESWLIKGYKHKLVLTGGEARGVLYSVYHFLEEVMGAKWWNPWEEHVPQLNNMILEENIHIEGTPTFEYREIYDAIYPEKSETHSLFQTRNRINGHFSKAPSEYGGTYSYGPPNHVHTFSWYFPHEENFEEHPEWYAYSKKEGSRTPYGQLCLTNEELLNEFINKVEGNIRNSYERADAEGLPRPQMFSVSDDDVKSHCECEKCESVIEQKGVSGLNLTFVNEIAEAIEKQYPDAKIETLAYRLHADPPKDGTMPRDNVIIRLADDHKDILHGLNHSNNTESKNRLENWSNLCTNNNLFIWDYAVNYRINPPFPTVFKYGEDFKLFHDNGVSGMFIEHEGPIVTDMWDMKVWIEAKLMEDVDQDLGLLIEEFTDGYYGPAAEYIRAYLKLAKKDVDESDMYVGFNTNISANNYVSLDLAIEGTKLFDKAIEVVADDFVLTRRVNHARSCLDKAIALKYGDLVSEARNRGMDEDEFNLNRKESALRVISSLNEQIELRCQKPSNGNHRGYCNNARKEIDVFTIIAGGSDQYPLPDELEGVPRDLISDFTSEMFRLYTKGHGLKIVDDEESLVKKAAKITLDDVDEPKKKYYLIDDNNPMPIGIYNAVTTKSGDRINIKPSDIKPDEYILFKIENTKLDYGDYVFVFGSWVIQQDLYAEITDDPNQVHDVYVSMKFEGPAYGGDASKPNAIYVDRIIIVEKHLDKDVSNE